MHISNIEQQIEQAWQLEQQNHALENALQESYVLVSRLIEINQETAGKTLLNFVLLYVRSAPELMREVRHSAETLGLHTALDPLVEVGYQFFQFSPEQYGVRPGLTTMMVKSYLTHRMLEEINDICHFHLSRTIVPIDLTLTNALIHTLIGESFANTLDSMALSAVENLFIDAEQAQQLAASFKQCNLVRIWQRLPSLTQEAGLFLKHTNPQWD